MVTLKMVQEAQEALKGIARKTPLENANRLGENIYICLLYTSDAADEL